MSAHSVTQVAPFQPSLALNADFGHSPVGKLGESDVAQRPSVPKQIRTAFTEVGKSIQNRATKMMQTAHARADDRFTRSLQKTSQQVGEMLGALSKTDTHKVDGLRFVEIADGMKDVAGPLMESGTDYAQIFQTRLAVNISKMTTSQLVDLQNGARMAQGSSGLMSDDAQAHLHHIRDAVSAELNLRLTSEATAKLTPILEQACSQVARNQVKPGSVDFVFATLGSKASDLLRKHGQTTNLTNDQENALQRALIKDLIEGKMKEGGQTATDITQMIDCLSSRTLYELDHTPAYLQPEAPALTNQQVKNSIRQRMAKAEMGFIQGSRLIEVHPLKLSEAPTGPLHSPQNFVQEVIQFAKNLSIIQKHGDIHQLSVSQGVDKALSLTVEHLNELLRPNNLLLSELSNEQLHEFSQACKILGVELPLAAIS